MVTDPHDILGQTFDCACGRRHTVGVEVVSYGADALDALVGLAQRFAQGTTVNLVADQRTHAVSGARVHERLAAGGFDVHSHILPDPPHGSPACDEDTRRQVEAGFVRPAGLIVAVGSGVVNDLCKWIASDSGEPYLVVATAASMNGYASENIAPAIKGVKRVLHGTVPRAIVAEAAVIEQAPAALTAAGLGDVLAKPVSVADWEISHLLFGEYYCARCAAMIDAAEALYLSDPGAVRARDPASVRAVFDACVYSGLAMTLAGTSFPASGGEHLVSHVLDMVAMRDGMPHDLHGRQVGVGTICAAALFEKLVALEAPVFSVCIEETDRRYWGELTPVVEEEHAGKRRQVTVAVERLRAGDTWDCVRAIIRRHARPAAEIKRCLAEAGGAHTLADIGYTREHFVDAFLHSHQIRERYTVVDLARAAGLQPGAIHEIVEAYLLST